jgi:hypothetical protein
MVSAPELAAFSISPQSLCKTPKLCYIYFSLSLIFFFGFSLMITADGCRPYCMEAMRVMLLHSD